MHTLALILAFRLALRCQDLSAILDSRLRSSQLMLLLWQTLLTSTVFSSMFKLLLIAFDSGEADIECLRSTTVWAFAPNLMLAYMLFSVVLLMNMLIALMAKTFNDSWGNQKEMYSYLFAQQEMLTWLAPAVLRGLSSVVIGQ